MNLLVIEKEEELFVSLDTVVEFSGNTIKSTRELVLKHESDIMEFSAVSNGSASFKLPRHIDGTNKGKVNWSSVLLNEAQSTFILSLMNNSPRVVEFKKNLVKTFYAMRDKIRIRHQEELEQLRKIERTVNTYSIDGIEYASARGVAQLADVGGERHFKQNMKEAGLVTREVELRPVWKQTAKGEELNYVKVDKMGTPIYAIEKCSQLSNQIDEM